jgi:uncharacterized tellurite resistance protein B-like protein
MMIVAIQCLTVTIVVVDQTSEDQEWDVFQEDLVKDAMVVDLVAGFGSY